MSSYPCYISFNHSNRKSVDKNLSKYELISCLFKFYKNFVFKGKIKSTTKKKKVKDEEEKEEYLKKWWRKVGNGGKRHVLCITKLKIQKQ